MWPPTRLSPLEQFAADFIADIDHYDDVRSEALAAALRSRFTLPPFPDIDDLRALCFDLDIPLWHLPHNIRGVEAANFAMGSDVAILVRDSLRGPRLASSLAHEIREAIENAFQRVKPDYEGLPTHDNAAMNPVSDRFAGYLLMETEASRALLLDLGFDFVEFSCRTGRPLDAVLLRAQQLFPAKSANGPVLGTWLFEAPWAIVAQGEAVTGDLKALYGARLNGFSQRKGTLAASAFPRRGARLSDFDLLQHAVEEQSACSVTIVNMGLFHDHDYLVIAEPIPLWGGPWRALVTAVRLDGLPAVRPLLARVQPQYLRERQQRL